MHLTKAIGLATLVVDAYAYVVAPRAPNLPDRQPFGYGAQVTGGGTPTAESTFVVDNMMDLRAALKSNVSRTVYVKGEIMGNQIDKTTTGNCQHYIDISPFPQFNFTLYFMATNETYTSSVRAASAAGEKFEGRNATEYLELLESHDDWRLKVANVQKRYESIDTNGDLTLIGWDADAYLNGVSLLFNLQRNIIIRNLRMSPPRDCFPAPESWPQSWNTRYDSISFVSSSNAWIDGNILADSMEGLVPPVRDVLPWGWELDQYDGLFDAEDVSDNITFSHNVIANHHKSLLWGSGEKEAPLSIGKLHFTVFGNRFYNSLSRNPLMRFGTFYIVNNVFSNYNNARSSLSTANVTAKRAETYTPKFQYLLGMYNMSSVLVSGNYFDQTGEFPDDQGRIFEFKNLATPNTPATLCSPADLSEAALSTAPGVASSFAAPVSQFNGQDLNLTKLAVDKFADLLRRGTGNYTKGGLVYNCDGFENQVMPQTFATADDVVGYVKQNAGVLGVQFP